MRVTPIITSVIVALKLRNHVESYFNNFYLVVFVEKPIT